MGEGGWVGVGEGVSVQGCIQDFGSGGGKLGELGK